MAVFTAMHREAVRVSLPGLIILIIYINNLEQKPHDPM
jgi:hypothetical protein